ncbi:MAG: hypothetical protein PHN88_02825 [Ignavibacteria bacterium]|nr:hypothetical protein [Ignavibacteria bacterium]
MEDYIYKNIVFKPRTTNFIGYRIPSIEFREKYKKYKKEMMGEDSEQFEKNLQKQIMGNEELFALSVGISAEKDEEKKAKMNADLTSKLLKTNPNLQVDYLFNTLNEDDIKERFFFEDNLSNAKALFNILFENASDMNWNVSREDFDEFKSFLNNIWNDFFLKSPTKKTN